MKAATKGRRKRPQFTPDEIKASKAFLSAALTRTKDRSLQSMDHFWFLHEAKEKEVWQALTYEVTDKKGEVKRVPFRSFEHMLGRLRLCGITPARFRNIEFIARTGFLDKQQMRYIGVEAIAKLRPILRGDLELYRKDKKIEKSDRDKVIVAYRALAAWRSSQEDHRIVIYDQTATRIIRSALKIPSAPRKDWRGIAERERQANAKLRVTVKQLEAALRDERLNKAVGGKQSSKTINGAAASA